MSIHENWEQSRLSILKIGEYPPELWRLVERFAEGFLEQGRPGYDVPHTHGVVAWAFELAMAFNRQVEAGEVKDAQKVDLLVNVTAAWLHDIGYFGQFEDVADYAAVHDKKALHMVVGARMAGEFLREFASKYLNEFQIDEIAHIISIHDNLDEIVSMAETIMVEADTLGMMDVNYVEPTYTGEEALGFPEKPKTKRRFSMFKTDLAKRSLGRVVGDFEKFVINRDFGGEDPRKDNHGK